MKKNWVEAYRPKTLSDVVFQTPQQRVVFNEMVECNNLQDLLLVGMRGTGKSSIAGALLNDLNIPKSDILKINCSDEKIEAIRDRVKPFAMSMPQGDIRVVRLEEFDFLSPDAQALLRALMDEVNGNCRFIATANYINKILPELRSRFVEFNFTKPNYEETLNRVVDIMVSENIEFEPEDLETIITQNYPDIRSIIKYLELNSKSGKLTPGSGVDASDWKSDLLPYLKSGKLFESRKVFSLCSKEELFQTFKFLLHFYENNNTPVNKLRAIIVTLADYEHRMVFYSDPEINICAMMIVIEDILNG